MKESYIKLPNITVNKLQEVVDYLDENNIEYIEEYKIDEEIMGKNFAINLKEYIEQDKIYQDYKKGKLEDKSDFDEFCINHCEDIKNALDEILKLKDKYDKDIEYLGKIADDYRDKNKELKSLCDKYEEEHKTTFEYWKHLIKEDYKTRIDKAIKYINERKNLNWYADGVFVEELLDILKGDNK